MITPPEAAVPGASWRLFSTPCVSSGSIGGIPPYRSGIPRRCADLYAEFSFFYGARTSDGELLAHTSLTGLTWDGEGDVAVSMPDWSTEFETIEAHVAGVPEGASDVRLSARGIWNGVNYTLDPSLVVEGESGTVSVRAPTMTTDLLVSLRGDLPDGTRTSLLAASAAQVGGRASVSGAELLTGVDSAEVLTAGGVSLRLEGVDDRADAVLALFYIVVEGAEYEWLVMLPAVSGLEVALPMLDGIVGAPALSAGGITSDGVEVHVRDAGDADGHVEFFGAYGAESPYDGDFASTDSYYRSSNRWYDAE